MNASDYLYSKYGIAIHSENKKKIAIKPKDILKYMEEYAQQQVKNCLIADVVISEERAEFCSCNNLGYWQMADGKKYCNDSDCRLPKQN